MRSGEPPTKEDIVYWAKRNEVELGVPNEHWYHERNALARLALELYQQLDEQGPRSKNQDRWEGGCL